MHYSRHPRPTPSLVEPSSLLGLVPNSSSPSLLGPALPSPPRYDLCDRHIVRLPEPYGFVAAALSESMTYREATAHLEWQLVMSEEIAVLERSTTWDLVPLHGVSLLSRTSECTRSRPSWMVLLSATRLVLRHVVFSRSMVMTTIRPLLLSPT